MLHLSEFALVLHKSPFAHELPCSLKSTRVQFAWSNQIYKCLSRFAQRSALFITFLFWIPFWAKWATSFIRLARAPSTAATLGPVPEYTFDRHLELWYFAVNTFNMKQWTLKGKRKGYWAPMDAWARDRCLRPRGGTVLALGFCSHVAASRCICCLIERLLASDKASARVSIPQKTYYKQMLEKTI